MILVEIIDFTIAAAVRKPCNQKVATARTAVGRLRCAAVLGLMYTPCVASDPLGALLACRDLAESSARLACFDQAAAALGGASAATGLVDAPAPVAPSRLDSQHHFGLAESTIATREVTAGSRAAPLMSIEAHILRLSQPGGRTVFTLDNGQVWRKNEADGDILAMPGDSVTISRGWLGSYWLQLNSGRGSKVRRIR